MVNILLNLFNSLEESRKGTLRGLIAFSFLLLFNLIYLYLISTDRSSFYKTKSYIYITIAYAISLILVAAAIASQVPKISNTPSTDPLPTTQVVTYGLFAGLIIYGLLNINMYMTVKGWSAAVALRYTAFGIVSVTLSSLFTYYCSNSANLY